MTAMLCVPPPLSAAELEETFLACVRRWKEERGPSSSTTELALCPSYQRIIGLGPAVVPLVLRELEREPDQWFWALKALTGTDPVPPDGPNRLRDKARLWIEWGRQQGYRW